MSKHKSDGKAKKKGSQLVLRIAKAERDAFVTLCDQLDTSAAREIRRFMGEFVLAHSGGAPILAGNVDDAAALVPSDDISVEAAATAAEPEVEAVVSPAEIEKPKKRPKRARP